MTQQVRNLLDEYGKVISIIAAVIAGAYLIANSLYMTRADGITAKEVYEQYTSHAEFAHYQREETDTHAKIVAQAVDADNRVGRDVLALAAKVDALIKTLDDYYKRQEAFNLKTAQYQDIMKDRMIDAGDQFREFNRNIGGGRRK